MSHSNGSDVVADALAARRAEHLVHGVRACGKIGGGNAHAGRGEGKRHGASHAAGRAGNDDGHILGWCGHQAPPIRRAGNLSCGSQCAAKRWHGVGWMDFALSAEQEAIRDAVGRICARFGDDYWLAKDRDGGFPEDFHRAFVDDGWLGVCVPQAYGGAGLGVTEAALMMQAIAESGAGLSGASALHMNIFGLNPVVVFGSDEQKQRMLPPLIAGKDKACFAVTEPNVGLDTLKLKTKAVRQNDDRYLLSGQKIWISTAQVATKMLILARTTPLDQVARRTEGLSLFYTDLDRRHIDVREIPEDGTQRRQFQRAVHRQLPVPVADRIGEEGRGFEYILHGMNPERILIGAEGIGLGRAAIRKAAGYAKERIVFDRAIGENQAIQHPLAACWMALEAANLMAFKAASLYDAGEPCGIEANATKYLAGEAASRRVRPR